MNLEKNSETKYRSTLDFFSLASQKIAVDAVQN